MDGGKPMHPLWVKHFPFMNVERLTKDLIAYYGLGYNIDPALVAVHEADKDVNDVLEHLLEMDELGFSVVGGSLVYSAKDCQIVVDPKKLGVDATTKYLHLQARARGQL